MDDKLRDIEKSQSFLSSQCETFRNQVGNLLGDNTRMKVENEKLVARVRTLEKVNKQRQKAMDDLQQYGRRDMIEVNCIPRKAKVNCEEINLNLASKINVDLKADNIDACHRISLKQDAPIIVRLASRKNSSCLLCKKTKINCKKFTIGDLGYEMPSQVQNAAGAPLGKNLITESLTYRNKNLLCLAKIKKRENDFKFFWTRNVSVYMRKNEGSVIKKISFIEDLERINDM